MVVDPAFLAVTLPFETFATLSLELVHVTLVFVALVGITLAVNVSVLPISRVVLFLFKVTLVTGISLAFTVTVIVVDVSLLPLSVTVAVPGLTPTIFPS